MAAPPGAPAGAGFIQQVHCTENIQGIVGLRVPNIHLPRTGSRSRWGTQNHDQISSRSHMSPLSTEEAMILWNLLPNNVKNNPPQIDNLANRNEVARALGKLCINAGIVALPRGITRQIPRNMPLRSLTYYVSPGGRILEGKDNAIKLISFVYFNMDNGHRVRWSNMTGQEQWEWMDAHARCGFAHNRNVHETRGLRGTDLAQITTVAELTDVITRVSPSIQRRGRPAGHPVAANDFNNVVRNLFN